MTDSSKQSFSRGDRFLLASVIIVLFIILSSLFRYLKPFLGLIIIVPVFALVFYLINHYKKKNPNSNQVTNGSQSEEAKLSSFEMARKDTAKRDLEIIQESKNLVNDSATLSVVESRYRLLMEKLKELSSFSDYELSRYGINAQKSFSEIITEIEANKITIFNQAIDRSCAKALEHAKTLKTAKGREQAIQRKQTDDMNVLVSKSLPNECVNHLYEAYAVAMSTVKTME